MIVAICITFIVTIALATIVESHRSIRRSEHHLITAALIRRVEDQQGVSQDLRRQLVDITAKYHQLRLLGAVPTDPPPPEPPAKETDRLTDEIHARYGHSDTLLSAALQQLAADRASKRSDDDILRDIIEGVAVGDGTPI